jgi:hypothetical protein
MTQEALNLALEALAVRFSEGWHEGIKIDASDIMLLNEAAQALAQPEQETVAWVGLTDDEIAQAIESINMLHGDYATEVAYAIESKLKDKNS